MLMSYWRERKAVKVRDLALAIKRYTTALIRHEKTAKRWETLNGVFEAEDELIDRLEDLFI